MVDAVSRVEQKILENWKELDNESEDRKVEIDAKREGESIILATFGSNQKVNCQYLTRIFLGGLRITEISESLLKSFYMSGLKPALQCALLRSNLTTLSEAFSSARATKARFAEDALSKLLQRGMVAEYQNEFEMLISQVTRKSESLLTTMYISGLKVALQIELLRARPTNLGEAFSLACIIEARFEAIAHEEKATASIKETADTITSLQSEVASLKAKGSLDANKEIREDHTLVHELEKQGDGDLTTMKFIQAEVECSSSPIFTSNDICPNGHIISPLNPTSGVVAGIIWLSTSG
ncbi:hypothetical protein Tco_1329830 [Tanacetum coccineum]